MSPMQQIFLGLGAVATKTYVDDVFSTFLYTGTGSSQSINNGIDASGEGAMTWIKMRTQSSKDHQLFDTVRGAGKYLVSNDTDTEGNDTSKLSSFNSNGFTVDSDQLVNQNNEDFSSWTFRKSPGFFDVVTWTGNGSNRTIAHSLNSVPGLIMVKCTSIAAYWWVYNRGIGATKVLYLNDSSAAVTNSAIWNDTEPTSTNFSLGTGEGVNKNGETYVAYVFAGGESTAATARSVEFDGTNDQLLLETNSDLAFGTGDFTIELWLKPQTLGYTVFFDMRPNPAATQGAYPVLYYENDKLRYYANSGDQITGNKLSKDQWQHIAVSRSGTSTKMFLNGIQQGSTYSDSTNYLNGDTTIGQRSNGAGDFHGYISNVRCVKGTAVYTSSFRPPTEPLTNITNTKLLCCNNSSTTGSTVTPSTITADGTTASTDSPFDDPAGFVFGESGSENVIKTGSYVGNGSSDGQSIFLGFEPQFIIQKNASANTGGTWNMYDSMRGVVTGGNDRYFRANTNQTAGDADLIEFTPTGFNVIGNASNNNGSGVEFIYIAIRRPDGYVGKPPELGTGVFAMDTGAGSSTMPNFDSGFPIDLAITRAPASSTSWETGGRIIQGKWLATDSAGAESSASYFSFDSNTGWMSGASAYNSSYQSWMWKRHAGFDVVTYKGNGTARQIPHNLSKSPEMIWVKKRNDTSNWSVYHKGLNGGTNPEQYYLHLQETAAEQANSGRWNNTAPTSTHFSIGNNNGLNEDTHTFITILFASVDGVSKVGSYDGQTSDVTITTGFQPRFILIKGYNALSNGRHWIVMDSLRGINPSGNTDYLYLNSSATENNGGPEPYISGISSTGFTLLAGKGDTNARFEDGTYRQYIYYAHA